MWRELLADENVSIANPDFCPVFCIFYDGTDFAYIRKIFCACLDGLFKYLFNIDIDFSISEFFAGI